MRARGIDGGWAAGRTVTWALALVLMAAVGCEDATAPTESGDEADDGGTVFGPVDDSTGDGDDAGDEGVPAADPGGEPDPGPGTPDAEPVEDTAGPDGDPSDVVEPEDAPDEEIPPPDAFEIIEPPPDDGVCVPDCDGKVCGDDGCGSICGYCTYPTVCGAEGTCIEVCDPDCDGKFCGPDGCGGVCGACAEGLECGLDGLCYEPTCVPDCAGKVCGSDGCGGDCGLCEEPKVCLNGGCALGPCGTVPATGECDGSLLVWCEDKVTLNQDDCSQYDGYECGYDPWDNVWTCVEQGECVPNCANPDGSVKQCGGDGCGGSCGVCTEGWPCELGQCKPALGADCGAIVIGFCEATTVWFCSDNGKLGSFDCAAFGQTCGWVQELGTFDCK